MATDHQQLDVAVVGCGASAVATLLALEHFQVEHESERRLRIGLFDPRNPMGTGKVYMADRASLLMNSPAAALSIGHDRPNDFVAWLESHQQGDVDPNARVPRQMYGRYLQQRLVELMANSHALDVRLIYSHVQSIQPVGEDFVVCADGKRTRSSAVILATGPLSPADPFRLRGMRGYIHDPFPTTWASGVDADDDVLIIGSRLSAVDVAVTLKMVGHRGSLSLASRRGWFPLEADSYVATRPSFHNITAWASRLGPGETTLSLQSILHHLRFLSKESGVSWRQIVRDAVRRDCTAERATVLLPTVDQDQQDHPVLDGALPLLAHNDMVTYVRAVHPILNQLLTRIPRETGAVVRSMVSEGTLAIESQLEAITALPYSGFLCEFTGGERRIVRTVVNGTGPGRCLVSEHGAPLYRSLAARGLLSELPSGGARVSFPDGHLLNEGGAAVQGLYAIGHPTTGTHPFINNIELIVALAGHLARSLVAARGRRPNG